VEVEGGGPARLATAWRRAELRGVVEVEGVEVAIGRRYILSIVGRRAGERVRCGWKERRDLGTYLVRRE